MNKNYIPTFYYLYICLCMVFFNFIGLPEKTNVSQNIKFCKEKKYMDTYLARLYI